MSSQFTLLTKKRFLPLFATQFLGALNDNILKNAMVIMIAFQGTRLTSVSPALMVNICAGLFILPFFLFSATSGQIADKHDKSKLIRLVKLLEIGIMMIAAVGFWLPCLPALLLALFLMGLHSTLFGPIKYSILPQHLHSNEMIGGNGLIESGTFLAILLGTILGGTLIGMGEAPDRCFPLHWWRHRLARFPLPDCRKEPLSSCRRCIPAPPERKSRIVLAQQKCANA